MKQQTKTHLSVQKIIQTALREAADIDPAVAQVSRQILINPVVRHLAIQVFKLQEEIKAMSITAIKTQFEITQLENLIESGTKDE